jgi:N-hydroxyarylamine O-acetyltransferase
LERLGYEVRRHLGRVGDPDAGTQQGRTHMVVEVLLDGHRLLCDPGFGMSLLRPIPMADNAYDDYLPGWRYQVRHTARGAWALYRMREEGWELAHTTDELEVKPVDIVMGHHYTSTFPGSHFTRGLMVAKHLRDSHVTVTHESLTIRSPRQPTQHRPLRQGEFDDWLGKLQVHVRPDERTRLIEKVRELAPS